MSTVAVRRIALVLAVLGIPAGPVLGGDPDPKPPSGDEPLPRLVLLAPGTKVGGALPAGWNHLVIKSIPRLESGDLAKMPAAAKSTATMFRTVVLADVRPGDREPSRFHLRRIGLGICVPIDGVDTVVSTASLETLHLSLGLIPRRALGRAEEQLARSRIRARTATFALYSAPEDLRLDGSHVPVLLRYALLVDPASGALETLLWTLEDVEEGAPPPTRVLRLPPELKFDCGLDVAAERLLESGPAYWSFAMSDLPPGQSVALTSTLRPWLVRDRLTPSDSLAMEAALRQALANPKRGRDDLAKESAREPEQTK